MSIERGQFRPEGGAEFQEKSQNWEQLYIRGEEIPDLQPELIFEFPEATLRPPYNIRRLSLDTFFENLSEAERQQLEQQVEAGFGEIKGSRELIFVVKDLIGDITAEEAFLEGLYFEDNKPLCWYLKFDREISVYFLERFSPKSAFFKRIYEAIGSPKLDEVTTRMVEERVRNMRKTRERMKDIRPEIYRTREKIPPTKTEDTVSVWVNGVSMTGGRARRGFARKRYIETFFVQSCVAVSIWDPETKVGGIAHLPPWTDAKKAIDRIIERVQESHWDWPGVGWRPEARIVGGWRYCSEKIILDILEALEDHNIRVVEKDILHPEGTVKNIVLDTQTGELYDVDGEKFELSIEEEKEIECRGGDVWAVVRGIDEYRALERDFRSGKKQPTYDFDPRGL